MKGTYISPLTGTSRTNHLYSQIGVPLFQNKVYDSFEEAIEAKTIDVNLVQCLDTGFVFSGDFDIDKLEYDLNYQNEQANSFFFREHLNNVFDLLKEKGLLHGKILEVGCGKGFFMDMLLKNGFDVVGIDPTYEGDSERVIKDYYSEKYSYLNADLVILRHTLEHIPRPFEFIKMIAKSNLYKGKIYIEIPTFDWIAKNNSIEDVFYEHCNYFTPSTISLLFNNCEVQCVFNNQYIGIIADLAQIKEEIMPIKDFEQYTLEFEKKLKSYYDKIISLNNIAIWGAGAKGSTFLNLLDKKRDYIKAVIDINPKKQKKFIGGTGHEIVSPNNLNFFENIVVMNENYYDEIKKIVGNKINLITL